MTTIIKISYYDEPEVEWQSHNTLDLKRVVHVAYWIWILSERDIENHWGLFDHM